MKVLATTPGYGRTLKTVIVEMSAEEYFNAVGADEENRRADPVAGQDVPLVVPGIVVKVAAQLRRESETIRGQAQSIANQLGWMAERLEKYGSDSVPNSGA